MRKTFESVFLETQSENKGDPWPLKDKKFKDFFKKSWKRGNLYDKKGEYTRLENQIEFIKERSEYDDYYLKESFGDGELKYKDNS